jgi:lipopolysaccharide transport system ATP-binding protein
VASLLEVGTGFHPELTGRENIFLAGAILGMTRAEIRAALRRHRRVRREWSASCDTPVKHYSSGMYVRLAFAVAAHLECDILIVDEVLSVGDAVSRSAAWASSRAWRNRAARCLREPQHGKSCSACATARCC